jgi:hypothetical protein
LARGEHAVVTARAPERLRHLIERYPAESVLPLMRRVCSGHIGNGQQPGNWAATAEAIIASVDADAAGPGAFPQR